MFLAVTTTTSTGLWLVLLPGGGAVAPTSDAAGVLLPQTAGVLLPQAAGVLLPQAAGAAAAHRLKAQPVPQ